MPHRSKITESTVRAILLNQDTHQACAKIHGISWQAVQQIRLGVIHKKKAPEVPRWAKRGPGTLSSLSIPPKMLEHHSCQPCLHWHKGACSMGFPEPTENLRFANECNVYSK